jgi:aquaporin Z
MKKYAAEFIGTFSLVLFGCGSAVIAGISGTGPSGIGLLGIAIAFGFSVVAMAYAIGGISGCHINPAVTIGVFTAGKMTWQDAVGYIIAQCLGGIAAAAVLYLIVSGRLHGFTLGEWSLGSNGWGEGYNGAYNTLSAFVIEAVMTFLFIFVILGTTSKFGNGAMAGLAIGVTLMLIHLVTIPVTGTSVNPARSLGPAIFAGGKALSQLWLFFVAPITGAIIAALVWRFGFDREK